MNTSILTLITCVSLLVLAAITPLINCFYRKISIKPKDENYPTDKQETNPERQTLTNGETRTDCRQEKISVIIVALDNAKELEQHLPHFLSQDYDAGYEVIVVTVKGDIDTEDVLKRHGENPILYTTFIPESSRYMSRKKLAITLGVKAAHNEWMALTDATCRPESSHWLKNMALSCREDCNMVMGYSRYDETAREFERFEQLQREFYNLRSAQRRTAYGTTGKNLLFRKSLFMEGRGFEGNLKYLYGEYDFMVNKYASKNHVAVELDHSTWLTEDAPTRRQWRNKQLYYMESRRHMLRSTRHRLLYNTDSIPTHRS